MTGRHASTAGVDDQALADEVREPGAHRADGDTTVDPQGVIGDGSVPADADLQAAAAPPAESADSPDTTPRTGRRAAAPTEGTSR